MMMMSLLELNREDDTGPRFGFDWHGEDLNEYCWRVRIELQKYKNVGLGWVKDVGPTHYFIKKKEDVGPILIIFPCT